MKQASLEINARALDWISRLVEIDTTSVKSNLGLIEMVRDALVGWGLQPHLIYNAESSKANLFVTVPATGGCTSGGGGSSASPTTT